MCLPFLDLVVSFHKDWEAKGTTGRSRWGWGRNDGDGGNNDRRREVLNGDVNEGNSFDDFFETLMDVCILGLGVGVAKLRTREVILLGGDIGENFKEVGRGGNKDGGSGSDGDNGWRVDNERG